MRLLSRVPLLVWLFPVFVIGWASYVAMSDSLWLAVYNWAINVPCSIAATWIWHRLLTDD